MTLCQYEAKVALNYEKIEKHRERIVRIRPFKYQYDWKEMNSYRVKDKKKKFEKHDYTIVLNTLFLPMDSGRLGKIK